MLPNRNYRGYGRYDEKCSPEYSPPRIALNERDAQRPARYARSRKHQCHDERW
jgi:hypothetical protein